MNYPVWQLDFAGGGLLIAAIAIFHVYISHFAVGGGLFLVLAEMKGHRENSPAILDYVKSHTKFFMLLTLVLGAMTGVAIWFTIALLAPAATSILIHNFVFGWAIEWVFFLGEIVAIFIYYYTFGKMEKRNHLLIGWLYFIFAWLSLFVINGIIGFMLTPGDWLVTGDFWDGFFNPSFWPALFFRTFLCLMLAGLYGFLTSTNIKDETLRLTMVRYCAKWLLAPFFLFLASAYWYVQILPPAPREWLINFNPEMAPFIKTFIMISPILFLGGLLMAIKLPQTAKRSLAILLLLIGITYMGSFEYLREGSRRPYTINGHIYANSILKQDLARVEAEGILAAAKWAEQEITDENRLAVGRRLYDMSCLPCHSIGGPIRDIQKMTAGFTTIEAMEARLSGMGKMKNYMPPFVGNQAERHALATYLIEEIQGRKEAPATAAVTELPTHPPYFNPDSSDYVLLAWSEEGIHAVSDADQYLSLATPGSTIKAILIRRAETPEIISDQVRLTYRIEDGHSKPTSQVFFWDHAPALTDKEIKAGHGLTGNQLQGEMRLNAQSRYYVADRLPVIPYNDKGDYRPYPLLTIEARDDNGRIIATTMVVAPVSTEMGCNNCHGGSWRKTVAGLSPVTARDILTVHDRLNQTSLYKMAEQGKPLRCQECHPDPRQAGGKTGQLSLSAAIHGFHAPILSDRGAEACYFCHGADPEGATRFFRGIHKEIGLDCTQCHGTMEEHALSLLIAEKEAGKPGAQRLMERLQPQTPTKIAEIKGRRAWINEPDCLSCHVNFAPPETESAFNAWTPEESALFRSRTDEMGIPCAACHNSAHAIYPTINPYGADRDNLGPLQYQNNPYPIGANKNCPLCHTIIMEEEMHHPNSLRMFRNTRAQ
ncbi:MAG: cytochrome ubiquinol oxidase subunit I [Desulfobulbaceae bacterium]|nr:cytochrome ubiquinol oxidase subunit I [Desulfobulbaceae bacterium]HIJ79995.1 cytochrome C [Deltaproteobacteria bacterium]